MMPVATVLPNPTRFRYERKFVTAYMSRYEVESIVKLHPSMFSEVCPQRFVNNIYFDTLRLSSYFYNEDKQKKQHQDKLIPSVLEPVGPSKEFRKNWARLIQKIYEVDPLTYPKCQRRMRIISFIEDDDVTRLLCLCMT